MRQGMKGFEKREETSGRNIRHWDERALMGSFIFMIQNILIWRI
jgi:hypothetical protein